ncbi:NACHT domain-containing protein [Pseudomonas sp.]|uniref:phosphorylase family protein n=1 Tax=Pseudomonas sp. TaxID=306 RepID=UPI002899F82E|nr:NACHT domain-containing protein [Pseudomonas sp.]
MDKILLVVITDTEYKSIYQHFTSQGDPEHISLVTIQNGFIAGKEVTLCKMGDMGSKTQGSVGSALATVIDRVKPTLVLEVGICFGLKKDFKIGDVCISKLTFDYEYQKVESGIIQNRLRHFHASKEIFTKLSHFSLHYNSNFAIRAGNYACGDKVVNDTELKNTIIKAIPDVVAGDMESYALALVCEEKNVPWCVVKASSDDGVNKHDDDQERAASNAAKFTSDFLASLNTTTSGSKMEVDTDTDKTFFEGITQEITSKKNFKAETLHRNSFGLHIHHHPDMEGAWIIVYLYKAKSVPEALRALLKHLETPPVRIDLCIVSRELITDSQLSNYSEQLSEAGCKKIYVNPVKKFIYDRVVKGFVPEVRVIPEERYVDQKVYREGASSLSSKTYAASFIRPRSNSSVTLKPISVILGQGGIGKTTLCKSIASHFARQSEQNEYLLLITKSDILNKYSGLPINSITDLYREYRNENGDAPSAIGDRSFEIALSSGSLVVMIDGIDEIESAIGPNFNMIGFIDSIGSLNDTLGSCKVFLTSRHLGADRFRSLANSDVLELKGFNSDDVNEYLDHLDPQLHRRIRKIVTQIQTPTGFVNPYLLSIAVRVFADSDGSDDIHTNLLDTNEPFEYILARMLGREIEKQSLGVPVDSYYELLDYIIIECENSLSLQDFQGYIETMLCPAGLSPETLSANYLKCLLFRVSDQRVVVDQEEYVALIRAKGLYNIITDSSQLSAHDINRALAIFGEDLNDSLGVREHVIQMMLSKTDDIHSANSNLAKLFEGFRGFITSKIPRAKNAIYSLHDFTIRLNRPKSATEATEVLELLHSPTKFSNMYILGDFPALDLTDKTLESCEFIGYRKFLRCKIDTKTHFKKCRIVNSSELYSESLFKGDMFDEECFLDEPMKLAIASGLERKEGREARIRNDIKQVLKVMRLGLGFNPKSMNKIKQNTSLLSSKSYEQLLGELCRSGILTLDQETGTYSVRAEHQTDAFALCEENDCKGGIKSLIETMAD